MIQIDSLQQQAVANTSEPSNRIRTTPGDGVCEASASHGDCTLRAAIMETNQLAGPDGITIPAGTFVLSLAGDDDVAAVGDLDIRDSVVTITGAGANSTFINANGIDRVFSSINATVVISDLTIQNGMTGAASNAGGGFQVNTALVNPNSLTMQRVVLLNNSAKRGGAIHASSEVTVIIEDTLMQGNDTIDIGTGNQIGGAIYCQGCDLTITSSTITTTGSGGGKAVTLEGSDLVMLNSTISDNEEGGI